MIDDWDSICEDFGTFFRQDLETAMNIKKCPFCGLQIWKVGGCMNVTCSESNGGCGKKFCWLCLVEWGGHGTGVGGFYACNHCTAAAKEGYLRSEAICALDVQQKVEEVKDVTKRYDWHFERHKFMEISMRSAEERSLTQCDGTCSVCKGSDARKCRKGLIAAQQELIEKALKPILNQPPSAHQMTTLDALPAANRALAACRAALRWIYGKCTLLATSSM
jgi:hypothetical protein